VATTRCFRRIGVGPMLALTIAILPMHVARDLLGAVQ
jgi:hypothetical protein